MTANQRSSQSSPSSRHQGWDVWAAAAIAAVGIILAVVFDQAPLLVFFVVGLALCTYIAIRNRLGDEDETPVENLDQSQKSESASGNASD